MTMATTKKKKRQTSKLKTNVYGPFKSTVEYPKINTSSRELKKTKKYKELAKRNAGKKKGNKKGK